MYKLFHNIGLVQNLQNKNSTIIYEDYNLMKILPSVNNHVGLPLSENFGKEKSVNASLLVATIIWNLYPGTQHWLDLHSSSLSHA